MRASRRLPGIRFEAQPRPATNVFPRMDVAAFAGFCASGPVHVPVPIEDPGQFTAVFGDDFAIARDPHTGGPRYAYLAPAVRAFFRNGGRRCWIVRLAGSAATANRFRIPGLVAFDEAPAFAKARSVGSWSDGLRVSTSLVRRGVRLLDRNIDGKSVWLKLERSSTNELVRGDLLRLRFGTFTLFVFVDAVKLIDRAIVKVTSTRTHRVDSSLPDSLPGGPVQSEQLLFDLHVRAEGSALLTMRSLAFAPEHPRYWAALPKDEALYGQTARFDTEWPDVWSAALHPRFPLAATTNGLFLPIGMDALRGKETSAEPQTATEVERDGLVPFDRALFLDEDLADTGVRNLLGEADFYRYQATPTRELRGIHAVLSVEEASIFCVPDAVHRGWERGDSSIVVSSPPAEPGAIIGAAAERPQFRDCERLDPVAVPVLECGGNATAFRLTWDALAGADDDIEEAKRPDFSDAVIIDTSTNRGFLELVREREGDYHYRLRRRIGARISPWSNTITVQVSAGAGWTAIDAEGTSALLIDVQTAILRMCAARGDQLALLTLPLGTREDAAIEHVTTLAGTVEATTLSYGAMVHPWLIGREENDVASLRTNPPDGATAGVMAARANARGAWVAPANEPLLGVVALAPSMHADRLQALQDAQINIVRQEPSGFVALDSDTLSADEDLRPINVRRLLILVRRAAIELGTRYVFEPNDGSLRRAVKRALEALLETMFRRGAFAGSIGRDGFQVTTGDTVNSRNDRDNGRFLAEVRVAPSLPLSFLTIRLEQRGDRTVAQEVR